MASSSTKKRKRSPSPTPLKVKSFDLDTNIGPRLASYPAVEAPTDTAFNLYGSATQGELIAGETPQVEFQGQEHSVGNQYLVGIYDKTTNTLCVRRAPLHVLERRVKRLKTFKTSTDAAADAFQQARAELGSTFGTKKAQAAIRAAARNKVDVNAMRSVADHLQARIEVQTKALPTKEEAEDRADAERLVPPYDLSATQVQDAYPLNQLIPDAEMSVIQVRKLQDASSAAERRMLLPSRANGWLGHMLDSLFANTAERPDRTKLKIVWYVSALLAFRRVAPKSKTRAALYDALTAVPQAVVDGLAARFMEEGRDAQLQLTPAMETKLATWTLALMLHADGFCADCALVAQTVNNAPVPKVIGWFKALGCKVGVLPAAERQKRGVEESDTAKWAMLRAPLEFPKIKAKPTQRR
ncbi:RNA polymerase I associated factor, A49-like protein [Auricularia subglabra TFB-10046 SS5]|nr:RNA polymerase I associated factor, A49-like protein [Auricularia subglabra TFB-10046 SS5]